MTANSGGNPIVEKKSKRVVTDADVQKRSVKMVVTHLKKKVNPNERGINHVLEWIEEMDQILEEEEFDRGTYLEMRKKLHNAIEWVFDVDARAKLRSSWYSFGKAMDKKAPRKQELRVKQMGTLYKVCMGCFMVKEDR